MAATLTVDLEHDRDLLALYVQVDGALTDPAAVEVQVKDVSSGEPGSDLFPGAGAWEDVLVTGRRSLGVFDVIDTGAPWKHNAAIARGRVNWRYKVNAADDWTYVRRAFQILAATDTQGRQYPVPFLVQDLRDVGVEVGIADNKSVLLQAIRLRELSERICRQHLRPYFGTLRVIGYDNRVLPLPEPLVGAQSVTEGTNDVPVSRLIVWGHDGEERRNPRLEVNLADPSSVSIFVGTTTRRMFSANLQIAIVGVWGFFEPDTYEAPELVRQALITEGALVFGVTPTGGGGAAAGAVKRETTDGHTKEWAVEVAAMRPGGLSLMEQATRDTLQLYRAPIAIGAPRTKWI